MSKLPCMQQLLLTLYPHSYAMCRTGLPGSAALVLVLVLVAVVSTQAARAHPNIVHISHSHHAECVRETRNALNSSVVVAEDCSLQQAVNGTP